MNDSDPTALSGLIASRICHDLISPVGAIGNGLELPEMAPGNGLEEVALIRQSADAATASLKFMRIAFGSPGFEDMMAQSDAARIFLNYLNQARMTAKWDGAEGSIFRADAQVLYLSALCLSDAAPLGGVLSVEEMTFAPLSLSIVIHAKRVQTPEISSPPSPRDAHHLYLKARLAQIGAEVVWNVVTAEDCGLPEGYARLSIRPL